VKKEAKTKPEAEDNRRWGTRSVDDDIPDNFSKESEKTTQLKSRDSK
jgi:hypothetical protein